MRGKQIVRVRRRAVDRPRLLPVHHLVIDAVDQGDVVVDVELLRRRRLASGLGGGGMGVRYAAAACCGGAGLERAVRGQVRRRASGGTCASAGAERGLSGGSILAPRVHGETPGRNRDERPHADQKRNRAPNPDTPLASPRRRRFGAIKSPGAGAERVGHEETSMYVRNAWYVACTAEEIGHGKPVGRTICGERMVLFRAEGSVVSALEDFCPHRGAPLSLGALREDGRLVCGYHGLVMGGDGKCVSMPGQRVKPTIKSYPIAGALRLHLSLARREKRSRRGEAAPPALGREPRLGLQRRPLPREVRLPADDRQPDGPHARDLRARGQHRPEGDRRSSTGDAGEGRLGGHLAGPLYDIPAPPFWRARCAATISPTTCRSTAGRSAAPRRRAT